MSKMKFRKIFESKEIKRSKKLEAFEKLLKKLEKKRVKLEKEIYSTDSKKKIKKLQTKLQTNKRHRQKAKKLIDELS